MQFLERAVASAAVALVISLLLGGCGDEEGDALQPTGMEETTTNMANMANMTTTGTTTTTTITIPRNNMYDASFLIRSTFGPTSTELTSVQTKSLEQWIEDQVALPYSSHRAYFRQRSNPRMSASTTVGSVIDKCSKNSRWNHYALDKRDEGKMLKISGSQILVDGVARTEIDPSHAGNSLTAPAVCTNDPKPNWGSATCLTKKIDCKDDFYMNDPVCRKSCYARKIGYPGDNCPDDWNSLANNDEFKICSVEDQVGGFVILAIDSSTCNDYKNNNLNLRAFANPGFWYASKPGSVTIVSSTFTAMPTKPSVLFLAQSVASCAWGDMIQYNSKYYVFDQRLELLENSAGVVNPAGKTHTCPTVMPTFLNEGSCSLATTCAPQQLRKTFIALDKANLQKFFDSGTKYVYEVVDLIETASPCGQSVSRWKKCTSSCTATSLSSADSTAIVTALQMHSGSLRDVNVQCANVAAGSIVQVDAEFFQHVHKNEHNVYDFTTWVDSHPGGADKITKWATPGDFQLKYPGPEHTTPHDMSRWNAGSFQASLSLVGKFGDTIDFSNLPASLQISSISDAFNSGAGNTNYFQVCGSPDEVANNPLLGNQLRFWYHYIGGEDKHSDNIYEFPYANEPTNAHPKTTVWLEMALGGQDQLRQRMAWALSQILVTSTKGFGLTQYNEVWVSYYDIFVRNAFGNFRRVLKEVTHHSLMGAYLTFRGNEAFDYRGNYPDENYAREIMQLFTIGLLKLEPDGTFSTDENGDHIQTYDNQNIMDFARVFTGFDSQLYRGNVEMQKGSRNNIDPMRMRWTVHDVYPKMDLSGGYIGDLYPLCSDLPARAFLSQGSRYTFIGYNYDNSNFDVKVLTTGSPLYQALCGGAFLAGSCTHKLSVTLSSTLTCEGTECKMDTVFVVQVGNGFYEYQRPNCVSFYFSNKLTIARGDSSKFTKTKFHKCRNPDTLVAGTSCCAADGSNQKRVCGQLHERVRYSVAQANCAALGTQICSSATAEEACGYSDEDVYVWLPDQACTSSIGVDKHGHVSDQFSHETKANKFRVVWSGAFPSPTSCPNGCSVSGVMCVCPTTVTTQAVFSTMPTPTELLARLKIGAFPPTAACTSCDGDVKHYGSFDENGVFEYGGKYYKNMEGVVTAGGHTFRNTPVFIGDRNNGNAREALAEVDALVDHLFEHPNTPVFISWKLIQRFGSSNPSGSYVYTVAQAFRTGTYPGVSCSGQYGDLKATLAAILLHSEARLPLGSSQGSLREPLLKLVHFIRSMEYTQLHGRLLTFTDLSGDIGEQPYSMPSVFNFYLPEFQPAGFTGNLVAPEFQLFTAPLVLTYINGMNAMVDYGISQCQNGLGKYEKICTQGSYGADEKATLDETVENLNVLLTGGRLTSKDYLKQAYQQAAGGTGYTELKKAVVLSPEFNTFGSIETTGARAQSPSPAVATPPNYKAAIVMMMDGGADSFNFVVPKAGTLQSEYNTARGGAALIDSELSDVTSTGQAISAWGIHHKLSHLASLYTSGDAAFFTNIGALVEPMTSSQWFNKAATRCAGLFSHSDSKNAVFSIKCQDAGTGSKGVGGRMSDALLTQNVRSESFSIAGTSPWSEGVNTVQQIVSHKVGSVRLKNLDKVDPMIKNLTSQTFGNIYTEEYSRALLGHVASSETLGLILENHPLDSYSAGDNTLSQQLHQVSRIIAARSDRKAERDFYYVDIKGFDTHNDYDETLDGKLKSIDDAINLFVAEMRSQNIFDQVVLASVSDFGRTLTTNGRGTDHGWAGQHFVIGGKVNGGKIFNQYPTSLLEGSDQDAGRGRLIPKYPWENLFSPIAEWMGVNTDKLGTVFPNLHRFNDTHIVAKNSLFQA